MIFKAMLTGVISIGLLVGCNSQKQNNMNEPKNISTLTKKMEGYEHLSITLPKKSNEKELFLEMTPGKWHKVDCNSYGLLGKIEQKKDQETNISYYLYDTDGNMRSTMMACPDMKLINKFVVGESKTINYTSNTPIIIFYPKGYEIKLKVKNQQNEEVPTKLP
ncbi:ecotin family protein [Riemerella anatipestifer]|nr:ecotin family protein [Riemerella anatipestifer]